MGWICRPHNIWWGWSNKTKRSRLLVFPGKVDSVSLNIFRAKNIHLQIWFNHLSMLAQKTIFFAENFWSSRNSSHRLREDLVGYSLVYISPLSTIVSSWTARHGWFCDIAIDNWNSLPLTFKMLQLDYHNVLIHSILTERFSGQV